MLKPSRTFHKTCCIVETYNETDCTVETPRNFAIAAPRKKKESAGQGWVGVPEQKEEDGWCTNCRGNSTVINSFPIDSFIALGHVWIAGISSGTKYVEIDRSKTLQRKRSLNVWVFGRTGPVTRISAWSYQAHNFISSLATSRAILVWRCRTV